MKRLITLMVLFMLVFSFGVAAQDFTTFSKAFEDFATEVAPSIPMLADVGLRWSDSYIGNFPHFGVGTSIGFIIIPVDNLDQIFADLGQTVPTELNDLGGVPVPAIAVEGRIGGFVLPFDIGLKAGYIPESLKENMASGVAVDYQMFGFDLRYRLVKEGLLMPEISVGGGYTYLSGMVSAPVGSGATITDPDTTSPLGPLTISAPNVVFGWRSSVLDTKVQVSKNVLFILRPYAGLGLSYGISEAGGGYDAQVTGPIADWKTKYGSQIDELTPDGLTVYSESNGMALRAYAGTSINLAFVKFDLSGTYNPVSSAYGAQFNVRAQF